MKTYRRAALASLLVLAVEVAAGSQTAHAQAVTALHVSVEVVPNCTVAATPLAFGPVAVAEAASRESTATIEVTCGADVPFTVALDDGQNGRDGTRRALDPATGRYLAYDVFADANHAERWGAFGDQSVAGATTSDGTARIIAYGVIGTAKGIEPG